MRIRAAVLERFAEPLVVQEVELAAPRAGEVLEELRRAHRLHQECADRVVEAMERGGDVPVRTTQDYFDADSAFHRVIFVAAGNRYLVAMHEDLGAMTHRLRQAVLRGTSDVREAHAEHERVLAALELGDAEAATAAMRAHIEGVRARSVRDADA